jgi:hypothetical protein
MDATECTHCGYTKSRNATRCPRCGTREAQSGAALGTAAGMILALIMLGTFALIKLQPQAATKLQHPSETAPPAALVCDAAAAEVIQARLGRMAAWREADGAIAFDWGQEWDHATAHERLAWVRSFAVSVACLRGEFPHIDFYRLGEPVAKASPQFGIRLID